MFNRRSGPIAAAIAITFDALLWSSPSRAKEAVPASQLTPPEGGSAVKWLITDQLGTPRMVLDRTGSLSKVTRHDYLPFGEELYAGVGGRTWQQGYTGDGIRQQLTGKERDVGTGLDYFGMRYYEPAAGRFISCDPVRATRSHLVNPQRWNLYVFVINNPVNLYDPDGGQDRGRGAGKTIDVFLIFNGSGKIKKQVATRIGRPGGAKVNVYGYEESTGKNVIKSLQRAGGATIIVSHTDRGDAVFDKKGRQIDRWSAEAIRTYDGWMGANKSGFGFETSGQGQYENFGKVGAEFVCLFSCALAQRTLDGYLSSLSSPSAAIITSDGGENGLTTDVMDVEFAIAAAILVGEGEEAESIGAELQTLNDNTYRAPHSNATDKIKVLRNRFYHFFDVPLPQKKKERRY